MPNADSARRSRSGFHHRTGTTVIHWEHAMNSPRASSGHLRISRFCVLCLSVMTLSYCSTLASEWKFPCTEDKIANYTAYHISEPIDIDGRLEESVWQHAPRSPRYVDII